MGFFSDDNLSSSECRSQRPDCRRSADSWRVSTSVVLPTRGPAQRLWVGWCWRHSARWTTPHNGLRLARTPRTTSPCPASVHHGTYLGPTSNVRVTPQILQKFATNFWRYDPYRSSFDFCSILSLTDHICRNWSAYIVSVEQQKRTIKLNFHESSFLARILVRHARFPRDMSATSSRGCYEKSAPVEFQLNSVSKGSWIGEYLYSVVPTYMQGCI